MLGTFLITLATALSLLIVDLVVPGVNIANFPSALIAAVAIGLINSSVKPVLSTLSLPLNFLTLGAFSLVVNGLCFALAAFLVPGFSVHGIIAFILGPVVLSCANTFISNYFVERNLTLTGNTTNQGELPQGNPQQ
ncbi:phage holin family protein [Fortiea sp. LEGE XX443]|uniref:phage holin family protein n=1 Tax=Fortiea sp. LEGE XX443 TaxID=1828611 RepID=UPI00187F7C30|nr:phage holin family protein [Fortiea sp. LEGE XX443]MBE9005545.1 phage holin family protein [Fortiea sp. LEGE XX443]